MNARPAAKKTLVTCDKCQGKGYLRGLAHYAQGVCFDCNGTGKCAHKSFQQVVEDPAIVAKRESDYAARLAFVETHRGMSRADIVKKFEAVDYKKVWALHGFVATLVSNGNTAFRPMLNGLADLMIRQATTA